MRLALVHDYLNQRGGAERVFAQMARAWPDAPVYTSLYDQSIVGDLVQPSRIRTSYLNKIPGASRYFRYLAPLYPRAFELFDFSEFDTIISSTSAWAKGIIVPPGAVHICFIHTVSRFVFNYKGHAQLAHPIVRALASPFKRGLIEWDVRAAQRPTVYVANSKTVAGRVRRYYNRDAQVLHSPIEIDRFTIGQGRGDYFFIASRLLPYKRIDLAIQAAQLANVPLLVAGDGPAEKSLRKMAQGTTTQMIGYVDEQRRNELLGNARAIILPGEEDLGLVPIEAAATGRPTIAFRGGGALETVIEGVTGEFFNEPTAESLAASLRRFDPTRYNSESLRMHAEGFVPGIFIEKLKHIVAKARTENSFDS